MFVKSAVQIFWLYSFHRNSWNMRLCQFHNKVQKFSNLVMMVFQLVNISFFTLWKWKFKTPNLKAWYDTLPIRICTLKNQRKFIFTFLGSTERLNRLNLSILSFCLLRDLIIWFALKKKIKLLHPNV
jgi:hypothetical protein